MLVKQVIAKLLLSDAGYARVKPVRVWQIGRPDNVNARERTAVDMNASEHVRHSVQGLEAFVDCHFEDGGSRVQRAIHNMFGTLGIPAATDPKSTLATVPGSGMEQVIQAPRDQVRPPG